MPRYYVAGIPFDSNDALQHYGVKGMKWNQHIFGIDANDKYINWLKDAGQNIGKFTNNAAKTIGNAAAGASREVGKALNKASNFVTGNQARQNADDASFNAIRKQIVANNSNPASRASRDLRGAANIERQMANLLRTSANDTPFYRFVTKQNLTNEAIEKEKNAKNLQRQADDAARLNNQVRREQQQDARDAYTQAMDAERAYERTLPGIANKGMQAVNKTTENAARGAQGFLNSAGKWVSTAANDAKNWAGQAVNDVGKTASDVGNTVGNAAAGAREWLGNMFNGAKEWAGNAAKDVGDFATNAVNDVGKAANDAGQWIGDRAKDVGNLVSNKDEEQRMHELAKNFDPETRKWRSEADAQAFYNAQDAYNNHPLTAIPNIARQIGTDISDGPVGDFARGIGNMANQIGSDVSNYVDYNITGAGQNRDADMYEDWIRQNREKRGAGQPAYQVDREADLSRAANEAREDAQNNTLFGRIGNAVNSVGNWVGNAANDAKEWAGNAVNDVGKAANQAGQWIGDRAQDVGDVATDAWNGVTDAANQAGQWIGDRAHDAGNFLSEVANPHYQLDAERLTENYRNYLNEHPENPQSPKHEEWLKEQIKNDPQLREYYERMMKHSDISDKPEGVGEAFWQNYIAHGGTREDYERDWR